MAVEVLVVVPVGEVVAEGWVSMLVAGGVEGWKAEREPEPEPESEPEP